MKISKAILKKNVNNHQTPQKKSEVLSATPPQAGKGTEDTFKTLGSYVSNDNQCCFLVYESWLLEVF